MLLVCVNKKKKILKRVSISCQQVWHAHWISVNVVMFFFYIMYKHYSYTLFLEVIIVFCLSLSVLKKKQTVDSAGTE